VRQRVAFATVAILMLAGCAGPAVRPKAAPAAVPAASASAASSPSVPGSGALTGDNIDLPQSSRYQHQSDSGPIQPPERIADLPEPTPVPLPRSRYGNRSPYTVLGHTYHVLKSAKGYDKRGIASWYGRKFNGYMTSSFEKYDMYKFTAAHKTLPLPTWARVTNLENGKSVIVRINDRGPFVANRLIDLSYAAAVRIGIWPKGTGLVEVQAIDPKHPGELLPPVAVQSPGVQPGIWLQVGAFADPVNADRMVRRLRNAGIGPIRVTRIHVHGQRVQRVRLGPLHSVSAADRLARKVKRLGLPQPQVAVD
jgi:rare lipoprotein A